MRKMLFIGGLSMKKRLTSLILAVIMLVTLGLTGTTSFAAANDAAGNVKVTVPNADGTKYELTVNAADVAQAAKDLGKNADHLYFIPKKDPNHPDPNIPDITNQGPEPTAADALILAWMQENSEDISDIDDNIGYTWSDDYIYGGISYPESLYFTMFNGIPGSTGTYYLVSQENGVYTYYWEGTSLVLYINGSKDPAATSANNYKMSDISSVEFKVETTTTENFTTDKPIEGAKPAPTNPTN